MDVAGDLSGAAIRAVARLSGSRCRLLVAGAGKELIEEVHWGLTPEEQRRVWFDFHWVWGPPEDQFAHLVRTMGMQRFARSTWWPLRLTQQSRVLIDLLGDEFDASARERDFADGRTIRDHAL
jgi:hypothetical protein